MAFTNEQLERYSRHIIMEEIGVRGQKKLAAAKVLIVGAGGLGSPVGMYLASAGIGHIGIADADKVDLSNLQRQIIHTTNDIGRDKVQSAKETIMAINPNVEVQTYTQYINSQNVLDIISDYDFIVDGTDSFASKFLINDACVIANKPFSHAGILKFSGQVMTVIPHESPCFRCVFEAPPPEGSIPTCSEAGVVGAMAGIVGSIQALETIKYITGAGELLTGKILTIDAFSMKFRIVPVDNKREDCAVCSDTPTILKPVDYAQPSCKF